MSGGGAQASQQTSPSPQTPQAHPPLSEASGPKDALNLVEANKVDHNFSIERFMQAAIKQGASDIHICQGQKPTLRIRGELHPLKTQTATRADTLAIKNQLVNGNYAVKLDETGYVDFRARYDAAGRAFRVNVQKDEDDSYGIVMRLIPDVILPVEELGLDPKLIKLMERPNGLVLITGGTGSGKSTTLASVLNDIAQKSSKNILTVEQPIEFSIAHGQRSIVRQHEVPIHVFSFAEALRSMMRQDPDIIMVGEIRDPETMEIALHAAETGHLVFGTLHTNDAIGSIERVVDFFEAEKVNNVRSMLARNFQAVISQELIRTPDGKGRVLAYESLVRTPGTSNLIKTGKLEQLKSQISTGSKFGMQTLDAHLARLVIEGKVDPLHAQAKARESGPFSEFLRTNKFIDQSDQE